MSPQADNDRNQTTERTPLVEPGTSPEVENLLDNREGIQSALSEPAGKIGPKLSALHENMAADLTGIATVGVPEWLPEKMGDYEIHRIDIKDPAEMHKAENVRKLVPYIGKLHYDSFEDRDKNGSDWNENDPDFIDRFLREFVGLDISRANTIYVISEKGRVLGFYYLKYQPLKEGRRSAHVLLTTLDKPCRGTKVNEFLARTVFENEQVDAFTGVTHTPQLVKSWMRLGVIMGNDVYFCGRKYGDKDQVLTERERERIEELMQYDIKKQSADYKCDELPAEYPHYVNYGQGIPPRKLSEVRLSPEDPLFQTFKELISFQQEQHPTEVIYGTIMMLKK